MILNITKTICLASANLDLMTPMFLTVVAGVVLPQRICVSEQNTKLILEFLHRNAPMFNMLNSALSVTNEINITTY